MSNEQPAKGKSLIIKGLVPGLMEVGKLKIGAKGHMITSKTGKQFQPPTKLDHIRVTTLMRGPDDNYITDEAVHKLHGEKPKALPVRLLYDDIQLPPNTGWVPTWAAAGTTFLGGYSVTWMEVPIAS